MKNNITERRAVCKKWGSPYLETLGSSKLGISRNVQQEVYPINGLRHPPAGDTSGWYIWGGEILESGDNFFVPLHAEHIEECRPGLSKYLGLGAGWRFLIAPGCEDIWFDSSILDV